MDYMADYNEAQANGHHVDCDGWMTSHRWEVVKNQYGTYEAHCDECGKLGVGSSSMPETIRNQFAGHSQEVKCDGRCKSWNVTA